MKNNTAFFLLLLLIVGSCKKDKVENAPIIQPPTQTVNLQLDSLTSVLMADFQSGFVTGEAAAVTLGPVANTFKISYVNFLLGGTGNNVNRVVSLEVYRDNGAAIPGTIMFGNTYTLTSSDTALQQIDLSSYNLSLPGGSSFRIVLETGDGLPSFAIDDDGTITTSKNWVYTGGNWVSSESLGIVGDFVIRVTVEENI